MRTRSFLSRSAFMVLCVHAWVSTSAPGAESLASWIRDGKPHFTLNPRYEYGRIDGMETSHAVTLKTVLGYSTAERAGLSALVEFADTRALDRQAYNAAGIHGPARRTPIADPETTELNQLHLTYTRDAGTARIGRQRYILDNARFVGNVGWRQNEQTFDAVTARLGPLAGLTVHAGYLHHINRIFADAADWDSASWLLNAHYQAHPAATITAYYYHLSFEGAVPTTDTFGGYVSGKLPLGEMLSLTYRFEAAYQDYTHTSISNSYFHGILGTRLSVFELQLGYEVLGSDGGDGQFLTPLATGHAFNGFADTYLDNGGPDGLRDVYLSVGAPVGPLHLTAIYHRFHSDHGGAGDGKEFDLVATYPLGEHLRLLAKAAVYEGNTRPDRERFILQLTATY